jgi:DNA repair exonuclease SbcCD ATPase subunit
MKNEDLDDKGQFKMRLDEEESEETPITTHVGDLRLEKLNTRVTLISILIPVLIVVVLVIAYLDIKKRVIQTEDTGQLTAESISKELESRFSSLTMAQKVVEENLARLKDQSNQSVAKVQINLKKLDDRLKSATKKMASQKEIKATKSQLDQSVNNVAQSIEELRVQLGEINQTLQPRISDLEKTLTENKSEMTQLEEQLSALDANKIDKAKMDVALKLEMLKIKQAYKAQLEDLQSRLKSVEGKVAQRVAHQPAVKPPAPKPTPASSASPEPVPTAPAPGQLEEQTIEK